MSLNPTPRRNRSWAVALVAAIAAMFLWVVLRPDPEPAAIESTVTEPVPAPSN